MPWGRFSTPPVKMLISLEFTLFRLGKGITVAALFPLTLPSPTEGEGTSASYFFADP
jgi:hypothetical protein